jgi:glutathione S-transferase
VLLGDKLMELVALVAIIALIQVMAFQWRVGKGRNTFNVPGPATSGHPTWERYNRVHLNTIENLVVFLPLLWLCGYFLNTWVAASLGALFVVARGLYS